MLPTTVDVIKAGLKSDPTITPIDRSRLLAALRQAPDPTKTVPLPMAGPRIVRRHEAATRLGVSLRTLDKWAKEGILPRRVLPGRKRGAGFTEGDLAALIVGKGE